MSKIDEIKEYIKIDTAYNKALNLIYFDLETALAKNSIDSASNTIEMLSKLKYNNFVNDKFKSLIDEIDINELNEIDRKIVEKIKKDVFSKISKIPEDEYTKYSKLLSKSQNVWEKAKNTNNYEIFKPYLEEIIETNKKFIKYRKYENHPYDVLLDDFEEGLTVDFADKFFSKVREELVPLAIKILKMENDNIKKAKLKLNMNFDKEKQKNLAYELSKIMGFDFDNGVLAESEHPFTIGIDNKDVRFTTHYYEDDVFSSFYSIAHEVGHAIYEMQVSDEINNTGILAGGSTTGIHEALSRFSENVIGKHRDFMPIVVKLLNKHFDLSLSEDEAYLLVNEVKNQFIRTEADELTYPIHVMIRYEIEKEIFNDLDNKIDMNKLKKLWDDKYESYLGIRPTTDSLGILQDSHWSAGLFGYFPSYAIGSAYASQIYMGLNKKVDVKSSLKKGDFSLINEFLKETIHKYGALKDPKYLIKSASNEEFNPNYYISYLKDKFSKIYGVENI